MLYGEIRSEDEDTHTKKSLSQLKNKSKDMINKNEMYNDMRRLRKITLKKSYIMKMVEFNENN